MISDSYLDALSDGQALFCGEMLKKIFLESASDLILHTEEEKDAVINVMMSFDEPEKVALIFGSFDSDVQRDLALRLSRVNQGAYFKKLYVQNRSLYQLIKQLLSTSVEARGPVLVKRAKVSDAVFQKEIDQILTGITSSKAGISHCKEAAKRLSDYYDADGLDRILSGLIPAFKRLNLLITDDMSFLIYVKFYFFVAAFLTVLPKINEDLSGTLDVTILSLSKLPSITWVFKVLGQLPPDILPLLISQLKKYTSLRQFEKRAVYSKLLKAIQNNLERPEALSIKSIILSAL